MKKIPTIFERDWTGDRSRVLDKPHPDCGWVFAGEGAATVKLDGTCCLVVNGQIYKRRELRPNEPAPEDFYQVDHDDETGKTVGWVPVGLGPEDRWHREAFENSGLVDGTYELIGPKVQGNPERASAHTLILHGSQGFTVDPPRTFDALRDFLACCGAEGIVWHHFDGRMAKIKGRDFGLKRGNATPSLAQSVPIPDPLDTD